MKVLAVVLLVLVVLLTGLPLGMAMGECPACLPQSAGGMFACASLVATGMILLLFAPGLRRADRRFRVPEMAFASSLDHPPRP